MKTGLIRKNAALVGTFIFGALSINTAVAMPITTAASSFDATVTFDGAVALDLSGQMNPTPVEDGLVLNVQSAVLDDSNFASGDGTASSTAAATPIDFTPLTAGDSFGFSFTLDASAIPSSLGSEGAASAALNSIISAENIAPDFTLYFLNFTINYVVSTAVSETAQNAENQSAFASAFFEYETIPGGAFPQFDFAVNTESGPQTQDTSDTGNGGNESFGFQLLPGDSADVVFTATGSADATSIPVPASLLMLSAGLLLMRRRTV